MDENKKNQIKVLNTHDSNKDNIEYKEMNVEQITANASCIKPIINSEIQLMINNISSMLKNIVIPKFDVASVISDSVLNQIRDISLQIGKIVEGIEIPKIEIPEELRKNIKKLRALQILKDEQWPYFFEIDDTFAEQLIAINQDCDGYSLLVRDLIFEFCNDDFIDDELLFWNDSYILDESRLKLLSQALNLYKVNEFAGCVSLLVCQFNGIINQIYDLQSSGELYADESVFLELYQDTHPFASPKDIEKIRNGKVFKEKVKVLKAIASVDEGPFYVQAFQEYLSNIIFASGDKTVIGIHPCRNKICHGELTEINNKECALKAILVTDMLLQLGEFLRKDIREEED